MAEKVSRKIARMNLEIDGKERKCMDSLHVRCLKRLMKIYLGSGWCKVQTEATFCATQEQALRTNYIKNKIDKTS